jgi:hypothetical protein
MTESCMVNIDGNEITILASERTATGEKTTTLLCDFQAKPYQPPPAPPLPDFRVKEARPFFFTGVDFAGPLYVKDITTNVSRKVWLCLYTCCGH